ncbi:MAG TPA: AAA family ATPase [Rhizobiaceae bacterium]|nr:AAA family ATPase [Rhizobiaceae bacterium]
MKITALRLYNVKRFAGKGIALEGIGDGVNVLCAANEFGKSTSFEALHALFFQPHSGTPSDVQRLRPYSGGNPLVEAEILTEQGAYRLTKQFYGGRRATVIDIPSGRLVAQADEAENFISNLIRGGTAGPAGLLWVRQGITGIEKRSRSEEDGDKRARENLLTSVQGEVEAMTGGRRMAEIVDACNDELHRLVTPTMRPKGGGPYEAALEHHKRLEEEEKRLAGEVAALREALDKRIIAQKRLDELQDPEEVVRRRGDVDKAQAAYEKAKEHGAKLKTAVAEATLARSRLDSIKQELETFRDALKRSGELADELAKAETRCGEARARREAASMFLERVMADVKAAETEEHEAQQLLARLDAALAARKAAEELTELRERLEQAEAVRKEIEEGEAAHIFLAVPAKAAEELQALEIELASLKAAREASLPTFSVVYREGCDGRVRRSGAPVPGALECGFEDIDELEIEDVGTLTLRSNRPADADAALEKTEEKRRGLFESTGVSSLAELGRRQASANEKDSDLKLLRQKLDHLAPDGVVKLREEVARRDAAISSEPEVEGDPEAARQVHDAARQKVTERLNRWREAQPQRGNADDMLTRAEADRAGIEAQLAHLSGALGPLDKRELREQALANNVARQQRLFEEADGYRAELEAAAPDIESAEATLRRVQSVQDDAARESEKLRIDLAELNGLISTRSDDAVEELWREASEALAAAADRVKKFEAEIAVLDRLRNVLQEARSSARDLYLQPVITELRPLLGLLFDDISIEFDETTLLPQTIRRNGLEENVDRLSGGMREQLSVLTRLAFARLLARDGRPAPVILDDALVYSDDDRIEKMFDALHRQSRDQQIIVFSCRQRAFAKLGGRVLEMIPWTPTS